MTLIPLLAALAAATQPAPAPAKAPPNPCVPAESCRFVPDYTLAGPRGEIRVEAGVWIPYVQEEALVVVPGETLVLRLDRDKARTEASLAPVVVSAGRADRLVKDARDSHLEGEALALNDSKREQVRTVRRPDGVAAVRAEAGTVQITFEQVEGRRDMIMRVDNGYGEAVDYRAVLTRAFGASREPTTVCIVKPGVINIEAWPYPIASIELSDFRFVETPEELALAHCD